MFSSVEQIINESKSNNVSIWEMILQNDCVETGKSFECAYETMKQMYIAMKESNDQYDERLKSHSGFVGGEASKVKKRIADGNMIAGVFCGKVAEKALRVAESNACMKRIVAAPTAGSCGVVPAVLITAEEMMGFSEDDLTRALIISGGGGGVIATRASLSGAAGGCQAEIGAAASMAAAGLAFLMDGSGEEIMNASALAMKNMLGLACDPVGGLVEVPCVKRNVYGAINAVISCDLALAGVCSQIPVDEVYDAMNSIGKHMSDTIKETAKGGLAITPTGIRMAGL